MLYCCGKWFNTRKMYLADTINHHNRILEIGICEKCKTEKAVLTYTDAKGNKKEHKPKKKDVAKFIQECMAQPYYELKPVKQGSRQNMFWLYNSNGTIKDFNGETKGTCKSEIKTDFVIMIDVTPSNHSEGAFFAK